MLHPRCPYAVRGLDSAGMAACPGYEPEVVPVGADHIVGSGRSCFHLRAQPSPARSGGYVNACTHPILGASDGDSSGAEDGVLDLRGVAQGVRDVADPGSPLEQSFEVLGRLG